MVKALVLLSGGLDSMLAVKTLQAQGVEVTGITFTSNFFNSKKAEMAAAQLAVKLIRVDISRELLELVKNPPSGHGKNLNPCIDCHALMIKKAGEYIKKSSGAGSPKRQYDLIATGEVLGQRPFSQNKLALKRVAKLAGIEVLRPLSAKLLPETGIEKSGLIDRQRLFDLNGRKRDGQIALIKKYGFREYPSPSGGCLLTEPRISSRLVKMLGYWPDSDPGDVELLNHGRIFWFNLMTRGKSRQILTLIGRNDEDNNEIKKLAKKGDIMVELIGQTGPAALIRSNNRLARQRLGEEEISIPKELHDPEMGLGPIENINEIVSIVKLLNGYYAPKARGKTVRIKARAI